MDNIFPVSFQISNQRLSRAYIAHMIYIGNGGWFMVFNATFNNISVILWLSVLLVEETRVPGENH